MPRTNAEERAFVAEVFKTFDKNRDKHIALEDMGDVLRVLGLYPSNALLAKTAEILQLPQRIPIENFMQIVIFVEHYEERASPEEIINELRVLDTAGTGFLHRHQLHFILTTLGEKFTSDEANYLLDLFANAEGKIDYVRFVHRLLSQ